MKIKERLIFGCVALSSMESRADAFRLLEEVVGSGIRHFDTARSYGRGLSEKLLGEFFRVYGADVQVTTKAGAKYLKTHPVSTWIALPVNHILKSVKGGIKSVGHGRREAEVFQFEASKLKKSRSLQSPSLNLSVPPARITREVVESSIDESLKQLGRKRLDIFLLHEALSQQLTPDAWEFLVRAKKAGVIGKLGLGTNREMLEERFREEPRVEVLQYEGSLMRELPLIEKFPGKMHIHHSLFRGVGRGGHGEVLRRALEMNPEGKVVFSTRSREHLRENLEGLR
jgi:aryl-alcohol dehydrogenase-like predicted oxidoreductase